MPGAYAHMVIVNKIGERPEMEAAGFPREAITALFKYLRFCELGAVSPDYPYLANDGAWADRMHYDSTGEMIRAGVREVAKLPKNERMKEYAWLLGYAAHVVADVAIHPIVFLRVGPYEDNKEEHRRCEMHQDVYIFKKLMNIDVGEHLKSGLRLCGPDRETLDPAISTLWGAMLRTVHPEPYAEKTPDISSWHKWFGRFLDIADNGPGMPSFSRHIANACTPTFYPADEELDESYLKGLKTPPDENLLDYDEIFARACEKVQSVWLQIALALEEHKPGGDPGAPLEVANWNMDTGKDPSGRITCWEA